LDTEFVSQIAEIENGISFILLVIFASPSKIVFLISFKA